MIVVLESNGKIKGNYNDRIFKSSMNVNDLNVFAPFGSESVVKAHFVLPDGQAIEQLLSVTTLQVEEGLNHWTVPNGLPYDVTQYEGTLQVSFTTEVYENGELVQRLSSAIVPFPIEASNNTGFVPTEGDPIEQAIAKAQSDATTALTENDTQGGRLDTVEGDIVLIKSKNQSQDGSIVVLQDRVNQAEENISDNYTQITQLEDRVNGRTYNFDYDNSNGVLKLDITDNGTTETVASVDFALELLIQNGYYDQEARDIILELANGTTINIPIDALFIELDNRVKALESDNPIIKQDISLLKGRVNTHDETLANHNERITEANQSALQSIQLWNDYINAGDTQPEVVNARGTFNTLGERLDSLDKETNETVTKVYSDEVNHIDVAVKSDLDDSFVVMGNTEIAITQEDEDLANNYDFINITDENSQKLINGQQKVVESGDVTKIYTFYDNLDYIEIEKPLDYIGYGNFHNETDFILEGYTSSLRPNSYFDASNIGKVFADASNDVFWLGIDKTDYTDYATQGYASRLEYAQADLSGKTLTYQLATPRYAKATGFTHATPNIISAKSYQDYEYVFPIKHGTGLFDFSVTNGQDVLWVFNDGTTSTAPRPTRQVSEGTSYLFVSNFEATNLEITDNATDSNYIGELSGLPPLTYYASFGNTNVSGDISALSNITYLARFGNTNVRGDISALSNLTYYANFDNTNVSGDISALSNITYYANFDNTNVSGDISALSNITYLAHFGNTNVRGDISALSNITYLASFYNTNVSGDISALSNLTYYASFGNTNVRGDISALSNITYLASFYNTNVSGDISALSNITYYANFDNTNVSGDISALSNITYYANFDNTNVSGILNPHPSLRYLYLDNTNLTANDVDQTVINLDTNTTATGTRILDIAGLQRSSASTVAINSLIAKGWSVTDGVVV